MRKYIVFYRAELVDFFDPAWPIQISAQPIKLQWRNILHFQHGQLQPIYFSATPDPLYTSNFQARPVGCLVHYWV
jgi:hypothetical protein